MSSSLYQDNYKKLRAVLKALRVEAGMTQLQLALALDVGQSYISKLERGESFVDVLLFMQWCAVCGVRPGEAMDRLLLSQPTD